MSGAYPEREISGEFHQILLLGSCTDGNPLLTLACAILRWDGRTDKSPICLMLVLHICRHPNKKKLGFHWTDTGFEFYIYYNFLFSYFSFLSFQILEIERFSKLLNGD